MAHGPVILHRSAVRHLGTSPPCILPRSWDAPNCLPGSPCPDPIVGTKAVHLAATIISSIPPAMFILVSASLPNMIAADGLDILLAICKPHYGATAFKAQIQAATDLCLHHIPVLTHMSQLQLALNNHLQGLALLKQHGEQFGDAMIRAGLMTLVDARAASQAR